MAQWLRTPVRLPEDPGQSLAPMWKLTAICDSSSRNLMLSSDSEGTRDVLLHTYIYKQANMDTKIINALKKRIKVSQVW